jgi:tight adherence protein C
MGPLTLLSAVLLFISITLLVDLTITSLLRIRAARAGLASERTSLLTGLIPYLRPLAQANSNLRLKGYRAAIYTRLHKAGAPQNLDVDIFLAAKEVCAIAGVLLGLVLLGFPVTPGGTVAFIVLILLSWLTPNFMLRSYIEERQRNIIRELPYLLDLLTASVEAGLDFMQAIERVVTIEKHGTLVTELRIVSKGLQLGDSRRVALQQLAYRTECPDVKTVVSALIQADQLGTGIGVALRTVAEQTRVQRYQRAEKLAGEATVKLLFPLMLVFAAVMLLVLGPIGIQMFKVLSSK